MVRYKQRCFICKKNMVLITSGRQKAICIPCQTVDFDKPIEDPAMKKMFDIPKELYEENYFLRDIKSKYLRFGNLSERQIEVFKKVVKEEKKKKKEKKE